MLVAGVLFPDELEICNMNENELQEKFGEILEKDFFEKKEFPFEEYLKLLGWLLYNKRLEIKLMILVNKDGSPSKGILHEKIGLFSDKEGNRVSFSGSANLTQYGWTINREEISVFASWSNGVEGYVQDHISKFNYYWDNQDPSLIHLAFPVKIRQKLLKNKANSLDEVDFEDIDNLAVEQHRKTDFEQFSLILQEKSQWNHHSGFLKPVIETLELRPHQCRAISYLEEKNYSGFLEMATGSGKTLTAIFASYKLIKRTLELDKEILSIIIVPDAYLVKQWETEIAKFTPNYMTCYSETANWRDKAIKRVRDLNWEVKKFFYFIGTLKSLNEEFWKTLEKKIERKKVEILVIADEAHSLGSPLGLAFLHRNRFLYKIGLSATPYRFNKNEIAEVLEWFCDNDEPFQYDLKAAQDEDQLMRFEYKFFTVNMPMEDFEEFIRLTKKIGRNAAGAKKSEKQAKYLSKLMIERSDILKKCQEKLVEVKEIINHLINEKRLKFAVIYCRDKDQRESINKILLSIRNGQTIKEKISWNKIDGEMEILQKEKVIDQLTEEKINLIIAMKCLDQGVDIPSLSTAIFVSSSGSPLEHIQRAGRLLRKSDEKADRVYLYDIVVLPPENIEEQLKEYAKRVFDIEKKRALFFSEYSENYHETNLRILNLKKKYD